MLKIIKFPNLGYFTTHHPRFNEKAVFIYTDNLYCSHLNSSLFTVATRSHSLQCQHAMGFSVTTTCVRGYTKFMALAN